MQIEQISALTLVAVIASNTLLSGIVLMWGRKLPRQGDWLIGVGLLGAVLAVILSWSSLGEWQFGPVPVLRGWVLSRRDPNALGVGILEDPLSYSMTAVFALIASALLWGRSLSGGSSSENSSNFQIYAGAGLCFSGASLAWLAATPWGGFLGIALASLGGLLSFGPHWDDRQEADAAIQYFSERGAGLILAILGALVLAATDAELQWSGPGNVPEAPRDTIGFLILLLGLFIQLQPFPLLNWLVRRSISAPLAKIGLAQVFSAAAAFGLLVRLQNQFPLADSMMALGWVALASALLASLTGLFQTSWRVSLGAFASSGFSLAACGLAFSGGWTGVTAMIATVLSTCCLSLVGSSLENASEDGAPDTRTSWLRGAALLAMAGGTGMVGFLSAGGRMRWLAEALSQPAVATSFAFVFFSMALVGWKTSWSVFRFRQCKGVSWAYIFFVYLLLLLGLGAVWTGSIGSGIFFRNSDLLFTGPLTHFFLSGIVNEAEPISALISTFPDQGGFIVASWIYWGSLVLAIGFAYWSTLRPVSLWDQAVQSTSPLVAFIASGYGVNRLFEQVFRSFKRIGGSLQRMVDQTFWGRWIPGGLYLCGSWLSRAFLKISSVLNGLTNTSIRKGFEVPGKVLQMVQSGNVQWYLFFAVGSGIAILIHFLRFTH